MSYVGTENVHPKSVSGRWMFMENVADCKNNYFSLSFYYAVVNQVLAGDWLEGMVQCK